MTDVLQRTYDWFSTARPYPNNDHFRSQLGCHFEEVAEMCQEIDTNNSITKTLIQAAYAANHALAEHLKKVPDADVYVNAENDEAFLDSICDQIVTGSGVAAMCQYNLIGALNEVNDSNYSKFNDQGQPIYDEGMKVKKGPNYRKADLRPFINL